MTKNSKVKFAGIVGVRARIGRCLLCLLVHFPALLLPLLPDWAELTRELGS